MDDIDKLLEDEGPPMRSYGPCMRCSKPTSRLVTVGYVCEICAVIPPKPQGIVLTPEQQEGVSKILEWANIPPTDSQYFHFGGFAGTGKTTVSKVFRTELSKAFNVVVAAFTGKAVNVLTRKGIPATTIHSLMYDVVEDEHGNTTFVKKPFLPGDVDIIVIDEASMISTELFNGLSSYDKKIIFIGDPGQLEPVGDNPNLMKHTDFTLTKILRQAESSPILSLATSIRQGGPLKAIIDDPEHLIIKSKAINSPELLNADQCICAKNKTRHLFNDGIRKFKKLKLPLEEGEKLICLRNNSNLGVFNGMILFVDRIRNDFQDKWIVDCHDEDGMRRSRLPIWKEPFINPNFNDKDVRIPKTVTYCGYGYVVTCHKSQGSEWDHVWVYDEWLPPTVWDMKRWRYTAITRASKKLTYCV